MIPAALWLTLFIDVLGLLFCAYFVRSIVLLFRRAPFVPTRSAVAQEFAEHLGTLPQGSVFLDLGCGDGRVLEAVAARNPHTACIGIEQQLFPYLLARLRCGRRVRILRRDFFTQDLSTATHVYAYLYGDVFDLLLPKFERELRPGTRLYSLDFTFSGRKPQETITLRSRMPGKLGSIIHIYEF